MKEIILRDGHFVRREITEHDLGPQNDLISSLEVPKPVLFPDLDLLEIPTIETYQRGITTTHGLPEEEKFSFPLHTGIMGERMFLMHRLLYYPLKSYFSPIYSRTDAQGDEGNDAPTGPDVPPSLSGYKYAGERGSDEDLCTGEFYDRVRMNIAAPIPGLWMMYQFSLTARKRIQTAVNVHLLINIRGTFHAPPLPNVFDTGKLCLGDVGFRWNGSVVDTIREFLKVFWNSTSNTHLLDEFGEQILVWDKDKQWNPPKKFFSEPDTFMPDRGITTATPLLEMLKQIEETDCSPKTAQVL